MPIRKDISRTLIAIFSMLTSFPNGTDAAALTVLSNFVADGSRTAAGMVCLFIQDYERKSSSSSVEKSSSARLLPPSGSPSEIFCKLFSPQAMPRFPLLLKA